jgi:hypothetical protein
MKGGGIMPIPNLPYHNTVKRRLDLEPQEWNWIKSNPENPEVGEFIILFTWQCAKYEKGQFFMLEEMARRVKLEIQKQADEESFARDATL